MEDCGEFGTYYVAYAFLTFGPVGGVAGGGTTVIVVFVIAGCHLE